MAILRGRIRELGALRSSLDRSDPTLVRLTGPHGVGKTTLLRRVLADYASLHVTVPPLPDPAQRAHLARALSLEPGAEPPSLESLFRVVSERVTGEQRPFVLALDDAQRLEQARARLAAPLATLLAPGSGRPPVHVVLSGHAFALGTESDPVADAPAHDVRLGPLSLRAARPFLPGTTAAERITAHAVFGGLPDRLRALDPSASLTTNLRRLVLEPGAPLADAGIRVLERDVHTPARYAAILSALSHGEADWATVHGGVPDLTTSGQVAPYLRRLEELGLVEVRRSLDAGPRSRSRRYRIVDSFDAFWFRFVLPRLHRVEMEEGAELLPEIRVDVDAHVASAFPELCRRYVALDALERLPANARESGSLWGAGYEIPVAGILGSGAAFYGSASWPGTPGPGALAALDRQIRETRYGFGRERRIRLLFGPGPFSTELVRRAAQRHDVVLLSAEALVGGE